MHRSSSRILAVMAAFAVVGLANGRHAEAVPFTISTQLTGDFRSTNPDNLVVDVTITGDTTSNVANWLVDLNAVAHPNATLETFAFNISIDVLQSVTFSNSDPSGWSAVSGTNVPFSGGADFLFASYDPVGPSNNVTNLQSLSFRTTLNSGTWSAANFLNAALSTGDGIPNPGAQLGAVIGSLSTAGCTGCSTSGFASGNFGPPPAPVPEPASLTLLGLGLAGMGARRWWQRKRA